MERKNKMIPRKYLQASNSRAARGLLRTWLSRGLTVEDIARQITERYATAPEKDKRHLGELLTMVYEFRSLRVAEKCADLFGLERETGFSFGQSILELGYGDATKIEWRRELNVDTGAGSLIAKGFPYGRYRMVCEESTMVNVLTVSEEEATYVTIDKRGRLILFAVSDVSESILVDEESFNDELPLYFTENSHFVSPVFKVNVLKKVLDYVLREIGYPFVEMECKAIFCSPTADLINRDDYIKGGDMSRNWAGVDVIMIKDVLPGRAIPNQGFFFADPTGPENLRRDIEYMLVRAVAAAAEIYRTILDRGIYKVTDAFIARKCRELKIFG